MLQLSCDRTLPVVPIEAVFDSEYVRCSREPARRMIREALMLKDQLHERQRYLVQYSGRFLRLSRGVERPDRERGSARDPVAAASGNLTLFLACEGR